MGAVNTVGAADAMGAVDSLAVGAGSLALGID